jgi:hypothetical protein
MRVPPQVHAILQPVARDTAIALLTGATMSVEIVKCPSCKQKLAIFPYVPVGGQVVCANRNCGASIRLVSRRPLRIELVPEEATYTVDYRPESYG